MKAYPEENPTYDKQLPFIRLVWARQLVHRSACVARALERTFWGTIPRAPRVSGPSTTHYFPPTTKVNVNVELKQRTLTAHLESWVDFRPRNRIKLAHDGHHLILVQRELRGVCGLEGIERPGERQLRGVERWEDCTLLLREGLLACDEAAHQPVHQVGNTEDGEEEDDERLLACAWSRCALGLDRPSCDEVLEFAVERIARAPGELVTQPAHQPKETEHAAQRGTELADLVDDTDHGEEARVRRHERRFEHLCNAAEGLHDAVQQRKRMLRRALERLRK